MKKVDLLKLVEAIADDGDINESLLGHEEFKGLKDLSKLGADDINGILTGEVGKAYMTSHDDSIRSKAVETFKTGKMQEEIKKAVDAATNKKKTPEMERIEALEKKNAELEAKDLRNATNGTIGKLLKDKKLPSELINLVYGDGKEETFTKNIDAIENIINSAADSKVNERLGSSAYIPPSGGQTAEALNAQIASAIGVK
ncbi:DUF4355 domain-containing protein [Clostridium botulinum]|uniref:DUF4355 domain-containing protein n=1 Tax=Clostridium botulinum (strain Eklund 17B / Type B) TaxID=935198 RepID=B2TMW0_CLOBB|nr:conserved hypothetical protein [Clostridium botulinum B str. Eklund 17B (NRP)]MBY6977128.1 DUF4355 domain-containing protein [Clostridium botulinum]MBY6999286.1 DUF4355 domain-containing protein [Clostridium botulinum]MCR1272632.1 DUF4355 domain-containing protein [Clostridium botulinum]NFD69992.1 DUF4355 domain-containing protein [Clostridium botulinum]